MEVKEFPIENEYKKGTATPQDVKTLREWLKTQPHLPEQYITDLDIILAYHSCNKSIEVAKQTLDINYSLRTHFTAYFKNRNFRGTERYFKSTLYVPLSERTKCGDVVIYAHCLNSDPNEFDIAETSKALFMCIDLLQYETGAWPGLYMVINFDGFGMGHMPKIDLRNTQQILYYLQEALPLRLKKIHLVNIPSFIHRLIAIMKPFLKPKMLELIEFHSDGFKNIDILLPLEAFPKDVGGNYKTIEELTDEVTTKLKAGEKFFEEENKKRVVESLRPGKPKRYEDIFGGMEGSFKKLEID